MSGTIFISHSSEDRKIVEIICDKLESRRLQCWFSGRDIELGHGFQAEIEKTIRAATAMVLILTEAANRSSEVVKELALASQCKVLVIPLRFGQVVPSGALSYELATRQWLDVPDDWQSEPDQFAIRIERAIRAHQTGKESQLQDAAPPRGRPQNLPVMSLDTLFKGREKFLKSLHRELVGSGTDRRTGLIVRALYGLGGAGKTRLAVEYALRHESEYSATLFVRAENPGQLDAGFASLAAVNILDLREKNEPAGEVTIPAAIGWLAMNPTWLMILDNVDDEEAGAAVCRLLPRLKGGHILITGRLSNFPPPIRTLEVGKLDTASAARFLIERTEARREKTKDDENLARDLADSLGGLALGIEQAGAYICAERMSFTRYFTARQENWQGVAGWRGNDMNYDRALAATWVTSVDRLPLQSRLMLERLAFFAPEPLPNTVVDIPVPGDPRDVDASRARAGLYAYSLISHGSLENGDSVHTGFAMHREVQHFVRWRMSENRKRDALREALGWIDAAFAGDPTDVGTWQRLDPLATHVLAVAAHADKAGIAKPTAGLLSRVGQLLALKARYTEAEPLLRRALAIFEASDGPSHPNVAMSLRNLALLLHATNRPGEAEPLYHRALAIDEANHGPDHPNVAKDLNSLALLLHSRTSYEDAELLFRRALAIEEGSYGLNDSRIAKNLGHLALLLTDTAHFGVAEALCRRALAIDEARYGPDHPDVARDLINFANLLRLTNRLVDAEPLLRRALAVFEASYGPDHPNVATALNNLGLLLSADKRPDEAEPHHRRAQAIYTATFGPNHPMTTRMLEQPSAAT